MRTRVLLFAFCAVFSTVKESSCSNITQDNTAPISVRLSVNPNPVFVGSLVNLSASVTGGINPGLLSGLVTFRDNAQIIGTTPISTTGSAGLSTSKLSPGAHNLQASYVEIGGSGTNTSNIVVELVQSTSDFQVVLSKSSLMVPSGDWTYLPVSIIPTSGFKGTVSISCAGLPTHAQCVYDTQFSLDRGPVQTRIVVNTSDLFQYGNQAARSLKPNRSTELTYAGLFALLMVFMPSKKHQAFCSLTSVLVAGASLGLLALLSCSGRVPLGAIPGTYSIAIKAVNINDLQMQHAAMISLVVE